MIKNPFENFCNSIESLFPAELEYFSGETSLSLTSGQRTLADTVADILGRCVVTSCGVILGSGWVVPVSAPRAAGRGILGDSRAMVYVAPNTSLWERREERILSEISE